MLGNTSREEKVHFPSKAVLKRTYLPATNLKLKDNRGGSRGLLPPMWRSSVREGFDHATFEQPHQYSTGMVRAGERCAGGRRRQTHQRHSRGASCATRDGRARRPKASEPLMRSIFPEERTDGGTICTMGLGECLAIAVAFIPAIVLIRSFERMRCRMCRTTMNGHGRPDTQVFAETLTFNDLFAQYSGHRLLVPKWWYWGSPGLLAGTRDMEWYKMRGCLRSPGVLIGHSISCARSYAPHYLSLVPVFAFMSLSLTQHEGGCGDGRCRYF